MHECEPVNRRTVCPFPFFGNPTYCPSTVGFRSKFHARRESIDEVLCFRSRSFCMSPRNNRSAKSEQALEAGSERARPLLHQKAREIQPFGKLTPMPIALDENVRAKSVENLNQLLADTM